MEVETTPGEGPSEYYYRRTLALADLMPAIGVGVGVGLVAFYVARVLTQRTPLVVPRHAGGVRAAQEDARERFTDPARERPARVLPRPGDAMPVGQALPMGDVASGGAGLAGGSRRTSPLGRAR